MDLFTLDNQKRYVVIDGKPNEITKENVRDLITEQSSNIMCFYNKKGTIMDLSITPVNYLCGWNMFTKEGFKALQQHGLTQKVDKEPWLLYRLMSLRIPYDEAFLEYILEWAETDICHYDLNKALSLCKNAKNAAWLIKKGAKCTKVSEESDSSMEDIIKDANESGDMGVLKVIVDFGASDIKWLSRMSNDNGYLNIYSVIINAKNPLCMLSTIQSLFSNEKVVRSIEFWRAISKPENIVKADEIDRIVSYKM